MPYRRLPTTDKARIRALNAALGKVIKQNGKDLAFSNHTVEELQVCSEVVFKPFLATKITGYRNKEEAKNSPTWKNKKCDYRRIRSFCQVVLRPLRAQ